MGEGEEALCIQVGESGWTSPLPLESNANTEAPEDFNIKPVLIRARIPEWGTVHEITARLELVGNGFERTLVRLHMMQGFLSAFCAEWQCPWYLSGDVHLGVWTADLAFQRLSPSSQVSWMHGPQQA